MGAKEEILARVHDALRDVPADDHVEVDWTYGQPVEVGDVIGCFVDRLEDYKATVSRCGVEELPATVAAALQHTGATTVVVPPGLDAHWLEQVDDANVRQDGEPALTAYELNEIDAVVTGAAVAVAETGTIILDHRADQGRRALTLVPDRHVCVLRTDQIVSGVPEALARLKDSVAERRPQTWISGGSATSDIELERVEGVHGPRQLSVIIVG